MALAISNVLVHCPNSNSSHKHSHLRKSSLLNSPPTFVRKVLEKLCERQAMDLVRAWVHRTTSYEEDVRFSRPISCSKRVVCAAASAAGSSSADSDFNPYEVLGVSPIEGFDMIKAAYMRRKRDAERKGDEATAARLEKAYDKVMMAQLSNRKKGVTFGSFKVSKDIKYADKEPILPWGPRFTKSDLKDMRINLAVSAVFTAWIFIKRNAEWKPLQFLSFVFVYRIFEKLKALEPSVSPTLTEDGEDEGRGLRMGKRLLRSLALVFGCIAFTSLAYTGVLNLIEFTGGYIPTLLYNNQELLITGASAVMLYVMASYYR